LWKVTQPGLAPTLYEYNTLGQLVREGLDLNADDDLDLAGTDRITTSSVAFHNDGTSWWMRSETGTYATASSGTHSVLGTVYERLTNFDTNVHRQTNSYDVFNNLTADWTVVDRDDKRVTRNVLRPGS